MIRIWLCALAVLTLGCMWAPPAEPPGSDTPPVNDSPETQLAIDAARPAASARLGVPVEQVSVERAEAREWSDSSLGCPQPGRMYAQVITPGYLVVVAGGGKRLEYHTDMRGLAVFCREL